MEILVGLAVIIVSANLFRISRREKKNTKDKFEKYSALILMVLSILMIQLTSMFIIDRIAKMIWGV